MYYSCYDSGSFTHWSVKPNILNDDKVMLLCGEDGPRMIMTLDEANTLCTLLSQYLEDRERQREQARENAEAQESSTDWRVD